jgi:hypothetical protein
MNTLPSIAYLRSAVPGKVPSIDKLPFGQFAINTFDGDVFVKRFRTGIGTDVVRVGAGATTTNLIWVTKDGKDTNSGKKQGDAKATIKAAVADSKEGTVIRVTAGIYEEDNPIKVPPQVSIVGDSLREVDVIPKNDADLFYVGRGNYITGMSFRKEGNTYPLAIAAFDPDDKQYINQSTYVQNCTNFIPNSIGLKIDGNNALGPLKSMVLDSFTQYNANGIGISITNEGYAQLVSLFTICSDTSVYCGTGGACDLTNSNSSFGNKALVANGVGPLKYTGILTTAIQPSDFIIEVDVSTPTFNVTDADYNNETGVVQIYTDAPHLFQKGMSINITGLAFTCNSSQPFPNSGRYQDASNLIIANKQEIVDKSLASIALDYPDFYFPGDAQTTIYSRYKDSYRLIQKNRSEITEKALASIAIGFPDFYFPGDSQTNTRSQFFDSYRLIQQNKDEIVGLAWTAIINQYPALSATESKCRRDLGYFVDAISTDIFTGGNRYSRDYTKFYFNPDGTPISNGINDVEEINGALVGFTSARELMKSAITNQLTIKDLTITPDPNPLNGPVSNTNPTACDGVQHQINTLVGIVTTVIGTSNIGFLTTFSENTGTFTPGSSKCLRDLGYFVDAVSTDIFLGGNKYSRDFTKQYFNNAGIAITNGLVGEESQSVYAFNSAKDLMKAAITNQLNFQDRTITADPSPSSGIVTNTNPNSCANVQSTLDTLVGIVTTVIGTNNIGFLTTFSENSGTFIPAGENKCRRDIGYIVDALAVDLKFSSNANIINAANSYFDANGNPISNGLVGEEAESVRAFIGVREYSKLAINNQLNVKDFTLIADPVTGSNNSEDSCSNVKTTIDNLIGILTTSVGLGSTPSSSIFLPPSVLFYPSGQKGYIFEVIDTAPGRYLDAADLINANRKEILDKSLVGIALSYSDFVYPNDPADDLSYRFKDATRLILKNKSEIVGIAWTNTYNNYPCNLQTIPNVESKCKRDLGYFVDAVTTDLYTGGNYYSIEFVKQYFEGSTPISNGLVGEEVESIYAFHQARDLMKQALTNQLTYQELGISSGPSVYNGVGGNVGVTSSLACTDVQNAVDTLVGIITTVIGAGSTSTLNNITVNPGIFLTGENVCRRDLGYVLDAIISDLRSYTNEKTLEARDAYFDQSGIVGIASERVQSIVGFTSLREYAKLAINNQLNVKDFTLIADPLTNSNNDPASCANVKTFIDNLVSYLITDLTNQTKGNYPTTYPSQSFTVNVGVSTIQHYYAFGGKVTNYISRPYDGQALYFGELYSDVASVRVIDGGSGYQESPEFFFSEPSTEWGIPAQAVATIRNGSITEVNLVSSGRGYLTPPTVTLSTPNAGITTAVLEIEMKPTYFTVASSTPISASGITTITLNENIPYAIGVGTILKFYKQSRILASSHCMEYIGTGVDIEKAIPVLGGVPIQENETISSNGGLVVYTTTDQAGNFRIGDGVVINQNTGRIGGTDYTKSLFATMTPFILSLGGD